MPDAECLNKSLNNNNELPSFLTPNELNFINKYKEYVKTHKLKEPDTPFLNNLNAKLKAVTQEQIDKVRKELLDFIEENKSKRKLSDRFIQELSLDNYLRGYIAREHKNVVEKIVDAIEYLSKTDGLSKFLISSIIFFI